MDLGVINRRNFLGVDQGADFGGRGPIRALAGGTVTDVGSSGIIEGGAYPYAVVHLEEGEQAGRYEYIAENWRPIVVRGQRVAAGQVLGVAKGAYPFIEAGWNRGPRGWSPVAPLYPSPHGAKPAGRTFWAFVQRLLAAGPASSSSQGRITLEALWVHAGGPHNVARTMAAIALAESGGKVNETGGPNTDGSYDYGLWQINSSHGYDKHRLLHDPGYNARAAVSVYRSQGLSAWSSYTSGAYRPYMDEAPTAAVSGATRPPADTAPGGGPAGGQGSSAETDAARQQAWGDYIAEGDSSPAGGPLLAGLFSNPFGKGGILGPSGDLNPITPFNQAAAAVSDVGSFLKWTAWLFSPRNILRVVEFTSGASLILVGLRFTLEAMKSSSSGSDSGPSGVRRATIRRAVRATPPGRALAIAQAGQRGRRKAAGARRAETSKRRRGEEKRAEKRAQGRARRAGETRRDARARRREEETIPF